MVNTLPNLERDTALNTGAPVLVPVERVEGQFTDLWRDVAQAAEGGVNSIAVAHVLNIIVRADSDEAAQSYLSDIQEITGRHPGRVIAAVTNSDEEESPVEAWVSIHCQIPPAGGRRVCTEEVRLMACGESVRQIPAAVIPLLIPDLPVFLWWPKGAPFDDYLFRNLADSLNRLIVDSSTFENPEGMMSKMASRLMSNWPKIACSDTNWSRLTPWREVSAQFFDSPALRPYLDEINEVTIDFALAERGGVNRTQALLFAGWLASRLQWEPVAPTYELVRSERGDDGPPSVRLSLKQGKRAITIMLNAGPMRTETPGDITAVKLNVRRDGKGRQPEASFQINLSEKEEECAWVGVEVEGAEPTRRHVQFDEWSRADLLDIELEVFSHDKIFEEALVTVGTFIRGIDPDAKGGQTQSRKLITGEPLSAGAGGVQRVRPSDQAVAPAQPQEPTPDAPQKSSAAGIEHPRSEHLS